MPRKPVPSRVKLPPALPASGPLSFGLHASAAPVPSNSSAVARFAPPASRTRPEGSSVALEGPKLHRADVVVEAGYHAPVAGSYSSVVVADEPGKLPATSTWPEGSSTAAGSV